MRDRRGELDMAHALAADLRHGDFDAALLADDALVLHALVLAAQALVVLDRTEDARAEQAVTLRLERAVVDGLRLLDLAERPASGSCSGRAMPMRISVEGLRLGLGPGEMFVSSFIVLFLLSGAGSGREAADGMRHTLDWRRSLDHPRVRGVLSGLAAIFVMPTLVRARRSGRASAFP